MFINKVYRRVLIEPRERKLNRELASRWEAKFRSNAGPREAIQSKEAALKLSEHLIIKQINLPSDPSVDGALSGSWPLDGPYDTLCLPNHAAKFFVDALNLEGATS